MNPCINIPVLLSATLAMASATSAQISATGTVPLTGTIPPTKPFAMPLQALSFGTTLGTSNALTINCP
jgi:hypothetical protein